MTLAARQSSPAPSRRDSWEDVQRWGKVRERVRNGRRSWWIDLRPYGRVYTTLGGSRFRSRAQAERVLLSIRGEVNPGGKSREAAVSLYTARTSPRLRLGYVYAQWTARMREAARRGEVTGSYVDHLERYRIYLGTIAELHYGAVRFGHLEDLDGELAARLAPKTRRHT
ncbi:MAG: hypothetical protein HUU22_14495 [Phycisphaerae bacterium]|nr:hypothetical protein [Phycisphaerae bacterium]